MQNQSNLYENVPGNYYDKYNTKNPISRYLMQGFLTAFDELTARTGAKRSYEVGCGEGHLSMRLHDRGWQVRGSDLEDVSVAEANEQCVQRNIDPRFQTVSLFDLTTQDAAEELVICCEVLEHVPDTAKAISVLKSLASPYLLVSVPREPIWRILNVARGKYLKDLGNTPGHIQHWSSASFVSMLKSSFTIVEVRKPLPWTMILCRNDK
ncbi:class I SAM-dependent methyltransferase [Phyllobacterium sophorae]|nr:class I SAM-dependent methyltransferase [Phyllobacterium sophorae]